MDYSTNLFHVTNFSTMEYDWYNPRAIYGNIKSLKLSSSSNLAIL